MPTPVKDIVNIFEAKSSPTSSTPTPSPARFLRHPSRRQSAPVGGSSANSGAKNPFEDAENTVGDSGRGNSSKFAHSLSSRDGHKSSLRSPGSSQSGTKLFNDNFSHQLSVIKDHSSETTTTNVPNTGSDRRPDQLRRPVSVAHSLGSSSTIFEPSKSGPSHRQSLPSTKLRTNTSQSVYSSIPAYDYYDHDSVSAATLIPSSPFTPLSKTSTTDIPLIERFSKDDNQSPVQARTRQFKHKPIPAKEVFSRRAPPLHLPHLDDLLSRIEPPNFDTNALVSPASTKAKGKGKGKSKLEDSNAMFPPLQKLHGKTLDELHHNSAVPAFYTDKNLILNSIVTTAIGILGSSAIANYYSLQGLYDGVQIFALVLSSVVPRSSIPEEDRWRQLFLVTIPNILALNIPTKLTQSLIFLAIFMVICGVLLYHFYTVTARYSPTAFREGLQARQPPSHWGVIAVSFVLTILYLPISTIAVHGLFWSSDFWVVANPYTNVTNPLAELPTLGPASVWREPLDFCFTTTMRKDEVNYAPVIVVMSAITFIFMTLWFPIRLMQTIRQVLPRVDPYTELGRKRSNPEMELEYQRLLERDQNPLGFLYRDFRRAWGTYKSVYLWAKLSALLIVAILSGDNCAFRSFNRDTINIVRQSVLTGSMVVWFLIQCFLAPFEDPVSNASEWISRLNYVLTSGLGLCVALFPTTTGVLNGVVLYIIYALTYGLDFYFALAGASFMHTIIKKITCRLDFSIDIFSPKLELTSNSPHIRRRIWQETIGTLILTDETCRIPVKQKISYSEPINFEWPPYLLDFQGTPGERHVENLKILREEGLKKYARAISLISGPEEKLFKFLKSRIENHFIGPDCYWRPNDKNEDTSGHKAFFGNAWWVPFPPTLVIRYDEGGQAVLESLHEFEHYVSQNESYEISRKREVRHALRALDRQIVRWPYTHVEAVGARKWFSGRQYSMQTAVEFHSCVFSLKYRGSQFWKDLPLGSGFDIELSYTKDIRLDGDAIGIEHDMGMTSTLAKFLHLNRDLVHTRLESLLAGLDEYRRETRKQMRLKQKTLSYHFLAHVYNWPLRPAQVVKAVEQYESDLRVRDLFAANDASLAMVTQRMDIVGRSEITVWWYLFWDDFWRRNHDAVKVLQRHERDFNPHYASSIAYRPLPRPAMEAFLIQRGLLVPRARTRQFVHHGLLNKIYFRMNQIAFHNTDEAILVHVGNTTEEIDLEDLVLTTHVRSSSMGTGGGTDLDDASIRIRPAYKWEDVFNDTMHDRGYKPVWQYFHWRRWKGMLAVWFGITPLNRRRMRTNGIALDVALDKSGRFTTIKHSSTS
ncbi:hypothetical protein M408DRAFT_269120 [Serendipita vermifera MAFF 305830]|uniref:Uncharacterized protein n=1 Tax=Serendipita vermifera MAFF 305830 TaxID=933852 RepID=A0A0C2W918_SERVB|nr:hypothetical protein M408DRAFT_269120 [Serendipita vermifera MAFF 305830]